MKGKCMVAAAALACAAFAPQAMADAIALGTAGDFAVLAGSTVTNTGATVITGGGVGVSPGSAITGFSSGTVTPPFTTHGGDAAAAQAQSDLATAYSTAAGFTPTQILVTDLGGLTLAPGVYSLSSSTAYLQGTLVLDAQGNPKASWVFQIGTTLTTAVGSSVAMAGGGQDRNVFWQVGSSATLGTGTAFAGNILALTSITLNTGATLDGRALAQNGAVTLDDNAIAVPSSNSEPESVPEPGAFACSALLAGLFVLGGLVRFVRARYRGARG